MSRLAFGAALLFLALAARCEAAAPALMTYQGRLKEAGLPVTGSRSMEIFLCDSITAGACQGTGAQTVAVTKGLFRSTFTVPVALEIGSWYLEVRMGAEVFSPRERLLSSPYAIYASSASTLIPASGSSGVTISTSVTIAGHIRLTGTAPSLGGNCGSLPGITGNNGAGRVTIGVGAAASCTLTFNTLWTNAPVCHFSNESQQQSLRASATAAGTVTFTTAAASLTTDDIVSYLCVGY